MKRKYYFILGIIKDEELKIGIHERNHYGYGRSLSKTSFTISLSLDKNYSE
jgi:hypothetical protein